MSSVEKPPVVFNLDFAPLGSADPPVPGDEEVETPRIPPAAKPPTGTVNLRGRTIAIKSVETNTVKSVERTVRPRSELPASASVVRPTVRRIPVRGAERVNSVPEPASESDSRQAIEETVAKAATSGVSEVAPRPFVAEAAALFIARLGGAGSSPRRVAAAPSTASVESPAEEPELESPAEELELESPEQPGPRPFSRYRSDPAIVARHALSVAERVRAGRDPVFYFGRDATDGMAVPDRGGLGFAVSIPFTLPAGLPAGERAALREALIAELCTQGLTRPAGEAAAEADGSWALLGSASSGELLVSPLLRDSLLAWVSLRTALEKVARHGGVPRTDAPAAIRVEPTGAAQLTADRRAAVARIVRGHRDVLRRLGVNPGDRPGWWSGAASGVRAEERDQGGLVFDFFDGSLEPGVVQANVKLALALTTVDAARIADGEPGSMPRPGLVQRVLVPDGRLTPGLHTVYELDPESDTAALTDLLAELFRRGGDIKQQLSVAALAAWPAARAVLTDEGADRAALLLAFGLGQSFANGIGFLPGYVPRVACEVHEDVRRAPERFIGRPFSVLLGVTDEGATTVFDGLEVTEDQFATLLRGTAWRPESGLVLTFTRLASPGSVSACAPREYPLPPPSPEDWPLLLDWVRRCAAVLGTCVHVMIPANAQLQRHVPDEVLSAYQAFASAEAALPTRDWRVETQTSVIVLRHLPAEAQPTDSHLRPGPGLIRLPEHRPNTAPPQQGD